MATLTGKMVWITGAGSGIGQSAAVELARAGAYIVLSGRRPEALEETAEMVRAVDAGCEIMPLNVADSAAVAAAAADINRRCGRVDILVNSAGINIPNRRWNAVTAEAWKDVMDININGALYCIQGVLPKMRERGDGLIINISSWAGVFDTQMTGPAYNASKHAMVAMNASLNMDECVNGIRACVICPGEVATPIMQKRPVPPAPEDLARMLAAEDLGRTIRFVAEMPPRVCMNEIIISPTHNRIYLGGNEFKR